MGADLDSFTIDGVVLRTVAAQLAPASRGRLDFRRPTPVTPQLGRAWNDALDDVHRSLRTGDLAAENALIRAALLHRLVATACAAFALLPDDRQERPARQRSVRRAVAFIEDHAAEPIALGDIAAAAGLSARALPAAFQRELSTSPIVYLRRVRLAAVRNELIDAGDATSVADIARRWGFSHLGRFAKSYRSEFGELPSATLRA